MSTSYGYRCVTCKVDSPTWFTNAFSLLVEAYRIQSALIAVESSTWFHVGRDYYEERRDTEPSLIDFLKEHGKHELLVLDEYDCVGSFPLVCDDCGTWQSDHQKEYNLDCKCGGRWIACTAK